MSEISETSGSQPPAGRVFPPWSAGRIVFWIVVGVFVSIVIGALTGVTVAAVSIWLRGGIDTDTGQVAEFLAALLYKPVVFYLIFFFLKHRGFSLGDAWGSFSIDKRQLGLALLAGVAYMSAADLIIRVFHIETPSIPTIVWDWRLLLASDILTAGFMAAVSEELLFRGLLYRAFRLRLSALDATLFSSLIFALTHTQHLRYPFYLASVFLTGSICALLLERTRSLNYSVAFHFAANTMTITTFYLIHYSS
jgi:membrane protease YdiL (CAAX protease family)